ncbi:MAG: D-alanyl-D-alanine carboxypeptidase/D-alanyl-D-alanine-endopeptidase, partial [Duodenibacillus sp.]|nr:D-alanyl-D-alanine carboxypeptidase/D-alanyl-D-alanine-endopeptidase [Duodenibacillus sp.]
KTVGLRFAPIAGTGRARITMLPPNDLLKPPATVKLASGGCGAWRERLQASFAEDGKVSFAGGYPESCGIMHWWMTRWSADEYLTGVLRPMLRQAGIDFRGRVKAGKAPEGAVWLFSQDSETLAEIVRDVNKWSNNTMARHVFLTLSLADIEGDSAPCSLERSRKVMARWLQGKGVDAKGMFVDNGSGLSRETRISARTLGRMLSAGYAHAAFPDFMASLPAAGIDGTMRKRPMPAGSARMKTGYLDNARALAGYVTDEKGERWSVVLIVNGKDMARGKRLGDKLLAWCATEAWRARAANLAKTAKK